MSLDSGGTINNSMAIDRFITIWIWISQAEICKRWFCGGVANSAQTF
jgi:hypothetical protein